MIWVQITEDDPRPWTIHRNRRGWPCWYQRWREAWWIITGKWSLHHAWQCGHIHGTRMEYQRTVVARAIRAARQAGGGKIEIHPDGTITGERGT